MQSGLTAQHLNMLAHDADLIAPAPHGMPQEVPVQKRRKRSHPVKSDYNVVVADDDPALAQYAAASGAAVWFPPNDAHLPR